MKSPRSVATSALALLHSTAAKNTSNAFRHNNSSSTTIRRITTAFHSTTISNQAFSGKKWCRTLTTPSFIASSRKLHLSSSPSEENEIFVNGYNTNVNGESTANFGNNTASAVVAASLAAAGAATAAAAATATSCESESNTSSFPSECLKEDHYNGITLAVSSLPSEFTDHPETFQSVLQNSLEHWRREKKRGIWVQIPTEFSKLIAPSIELGFDFHFAEQGRVVLTKWLPQEDSRLPLGPTHQVGVGALLLHPRTGKMLVVQEKSGPAAARKLWKMPTGLTDPGEDISEAAIREIKEETDLDCIFDRILCFRQAHGGLYQKSDMFFICLMRLKDEDLYASGRKQLRLQPQEEEIADIRWMDVEEYSDQELWRGSPLYTEMNDVMKVAAANVTTVEAMTMGRNDTCVNGKKQHDVDDDVRSTMLRNYPTAAARAVGFVGKKLPVGFRPGTNTIYVGKL